MEQAVVEQIRKRVMISRNIRILFPLNYFPSVLVVNVNQNLPNRKQHSDRLPNLYDCLQIQ